MATGQIHPTTPSSTETDAHTLLEAGADPSLLQLKNHQNNNTNAPVELLAEFLQCLMNQEYLAAKVLCRKVLELEPDNTVVQEFLPTIEERIKLDEELDTESSSSESENEEEDSDTSSQSSTDSSSSDENNDQHRHCNHINHYGR